MMKKKQKEAGMMGQGVSMIELLVTITVMLILSAILFLGRSIEKKELFLQIAGLTLAQDMREAQEMAMGAGEADCNGSKVYSFGVYFEMASPNSYVIFADCNNDQQKDTNDQLVREIVLKTEIEICGLSSSSLHIVFAPPEPIVYINGIEVGVEGTITLCLKDDSGVQQKVKVNSVGMIEIE